MRRFVYNINKQAADPDTTSNEVVSFEDYTEIIGVSFVGAHGANNMDVEIRSHDGKETFIDSVPLEYYKIGTGREEISMNQPIVNNSVRVVTSFTAGTDVQGALVFTCKK
ncbi:hypothetical protein [Marinifilum sp. D714]|uniref:hypothetical protein n=1 Tax=Marinifilum sp. D714 TaxID=2937523 RepID=UPI0027D01D7B|nr:hypothetical protein [Marinifilum sp. D714]MDQ2178830.1 hypothetical protein [Marinifilum sp. D714]